MYIRGHHTRLSWADKYPTNITYRLHAPTPTTKDNHLFSKWHATLIHWNRHTVVPIIFLPFVRSVVILCRKIVHVLLQHLSRSTLTYKNILTICRVSYCNNFILSLQFLAEPKIHSVLKTKSYVDLRNKKSEKKKVLPS